VPAKLAQRLGPSDNLVGVATMPLIYMTAVYAFGHVTQLKTGEKVLIQSATGGLGLAAKQLAQARGAEVFATVGTADKARFLSTTTNFPASHIFGSREVSELSRAVASTGGRGLDVILRACKGDMLY
jgi:NADPH:quinone reductase-like Zn-dependent oxidoreductase